LDNYPRLDERESKFISMDDSQYAINDLSRQGILAGNVGSDMSDGNFRIVIPDTQAPTVEVINPNGGEVWDVGTVHNITWKSFDNVGVTEHAIEYSTDGGENWTIVRDWTDGDPHTFPWTIPNTPSPACRVQIYCRDAAYNTAWDISNANFTINDPNYDVAENPTFPEEYKLAQNYPNPFNPTTTVEYALPEATHVTLVVYDILGRRIETLIDTDQPAGYHQLIWNAKNVPSGMYFYKLQAGDYAETKKMALLK